MRAIVFHRRAARYLSRMPRDRAVIGRMRGRMRQAPPPASEFHMKASFFYPESAYL